MPPAPADDPGVVVLPTTAPPAGNEASSAPSAAPAPGPGTPSPAGLGGAAHPLRLLRGTLGRLRRIPPAVGVWVVLAVLIVLPVGAFLLQAFSPRLFSQGPAWFTLANVKAVLTGATAHGFVDSLWVSTASAAAALAIGTALAFLVHRTDVLGRRVWPLAIWALLLMPTYLMADGWAYLLQPAGVLDRLHLPHSALYHLVFGPAGVVLVLTLAGLPFAYLTMAAAFNGLGPEYEEAARIHGAGRLGAARAVLPILGPAMFAALAIVFAESMSDFGVASTLAFQAHFPMATYGLFAAIDTNPANFGVAAALGLLLVASAAIPIGIQARALRGRTYAVLSGRTRTPTRRRLAPVPRLAATSVVGGFFAVAIGVPVFGAVVASLLPSFGVGGSGHGAALSLGSYREAFHYPQFTSSMLLSNKLSAVTAVVTVALGLVLAKLLAARRRGRLAVATDLLLLGSMALPGVVLAAGYVFAFNLPVTSRLGLDLYETVPLLVMGYVATVLPSQSRLLLGPMSQVQDSLLDAARVHGRGLVRAWVRGVAPVLSRTIVWALLFSFAKTLLELPVSQILFPPGQQPISVGIGDLLSNYHFNIGTAMTVVAVLEMFGVILVVLAAFRLLAPAGWRRVGTVRGA